MSEQSVPVSDAPLSRSELQKLDDGVFISEIRKAQAGVVARTRESADRAWKVAATIAAVVLATGFTTSLTDASEFVQVTGVCSIVAWLVAVGMFIRVNTVPPDDSAEWVPITEGVNREYEDAFAEAAASGDPVRERETELSAINTIAERLAKRRFRNATWCAAVALALTALTFAVLIAESHADDMRSGALVLTPDGQTAVIAGCPALDAQGAKAFTGELDSTKVGKDESVAVDVDKGVCDDEKAMTIYVDGESIVALIDP